MFLNANRLADKSNFSCNMIISYDFSIRKTLKHYFDRWKRMVCDETLIKLFLQTRYFNRWRNRLNDVTKLKPILFQRLIERNGLKFCRMYFGIWRKNANGFFIQKRLSEKKKTFLCIQSFAKWRDLNCKRAVTFLF